MFDKFFEQFDKQVVKKKSQGGATITFVDWPNYVVRAHKLAPGWSSEVVSVTEAGGQLLIVVRVTVNGVHHDGIGAADAEKTSWGGAMAEAYSQALRRAFAVHGMGLDMYFEHDEYEYVRGVEPATKEQMQQLKKLGQQVADVDSDMADLFRGEIRERGLSQEVVKNVIEKMSEYLASNPTS